MFVHPAFYLSSYILPTNSQERLRPNEPLSRVKMEVTDSFETCSLVVIQSFIFTWSRIPAKNVHIGINGDKHVLWDLHVKTVDPQAHTKFTIANKDNVWNVYLLKFPTVHVICIMLPNRLLHMKAFRYDTSSCQLHSTRRLSSEHSVALHKVQGVTWTS